MTDLGEFGIERVLHGAEEEVGEYFGGARIRDRHTGL